MDVIIEHIFCQYSDEATALYLRIINVILLSSDEEELRASMEKLRHTTNFDKYFIYVKINLSASLKAQDKGNK